MGDGLARARDTVSGNAALAAPGQRLSPVIKRGERRPFMGTDNGG